MIISHDMICVLQTIDNEFVSRSMTIIISMEYPLRVLNASGEFLNVPQASHLARVDANEHCITGADCLTKGSEKGRQFLSFEITQTGTKPQDCLGFVTDFGGLEPGQSMVVGSPQAEAFDMLVASSWDLREGSLKFWQRQVDSIILHILARAINSLEKNVDLA
jgi:hypothetical protein